MSEAAEKLKPLLAALPREDREELAAYLTNLNNGDDDGEDLTPEEWEAHWAEEIDRRIEAANAGNTTSIPHDEFMRRMKEKYG